MVTFDEFGPEKIFEVYDAKTKMHGFVVLDNTALGPAKGGIRMTPSVTIDEVARLARAMTWKCALAELPFGGGKSGIVDDAKRISKKEKMALVRAFAVALRPVCPSLYIAAPDIGTGEEEMAEFAKANGSWRACTGKPTNVCAMHGICGIPHEFGSTGFGVYIATAVAAERIGLQLNNATVAIEGFGNVGSFAAKYLSENGAKIVAVSDSSGCIYNLDGIDIKKLQNVKNKAGSVANYKPGKIISNDKLFGLNVDILIPSAVANVITEKNASKIKAKLVVEAANIPATPAAEKMLHKRGIVVVPDIIANAGGVISSYTEYSGRTVKDMFKLVENRIRRNTKLVLEHADSKTARDFAMDIAVKRVSHAMQGKAKAFPAQKDF